MSKARGTAHSEDLSIADVLADPAASFALKDVIRSWSNRDCIDAARDASVLCRLFELAADRHLGRAP